MISTPIPPVAVKRKKSQSIKKIKDSVAQATSPPRNIIKSKKSSKRTKIIITCAALAFLIPAVIIIAIDSQNNSREESYLLIDNYNAYDDDNISILNKASSIFSGKLKDIPAYSKSEEGTANELVGMEIYLLDESIEEIFDNHEFNEHDELELAYKEEISEVMDQFETLTMAKTFNDTSVP